MKKAVVALLIIAVGIAITEGAIRLLPSIPPIVFRQAFNFSLFVTILFLQLKKPVTEFFASRKADFVKAVKKAEQVKEEAARQHRDITVRLEKLESTGASSMDAAAREAANIRMTMRQEAAVFVERLKKDTQSTIQNEVSVATNSLREELLKKSVESARGTMKSSVEAPDEKRLQQEFIEKIQVV